MKKKQSNDLPPVMEVLVLASRFEPGLGVFLPKTPEGTAALLETAIEAAKIQREARLKGPKSGGMQTAKVSRAKAAEWQAKCVRKARELLARGRSTRELASILAPQFGVSARRVREVLKEAEIK